MKELKRIRQERGLTQAELARQMSVTQSLIAMWERGVTTPSSQLLLRLSELYGVSTDYLLGRDEKKPAPISESELDAELIDSITYRI